MLYIFLSFVELYSTLVVSVIDILSYQQLPITTKKNVIKDGGI